MSIPKMAPQKQSFAALHGLQGASAHFALGHYGAGGGFALQSDQAATQDVYIGLRRGNQILCLPFYRDGIPSNVSFVQLESKLL